VDATEKAQVMSRLDRVKSLIDQLDATRADVLRRLEIQDRLRCEIEAAKVAVNILGTQGPV
jgi:hypothetical protein